MPVCKNYLEIFLLLFISAGWIQKVSNGSVRCHEVGNLTLTSSSLNPKHLKNS